MKARRAAKKLLPRITPQDVLLVDAAGQRVARGIIVTEDDGPFPPVVLLDGDAFVLDQTSTRPGLTYTRVRAYRAGSNFR